MRCIRMMISKRKDEGESDDTLGDVSDNEKTEPNGGETGVVLKIGRLIGYPSDYKYAIRIPFP